ncbi:CDP-diacylglycerol--glycerol-3-phosphate 3-phosphatidyltransferase, mitochondrial [Leptidea sinapis]|uniref:CDP-diacylglycerol--glycerol-3-phosphate 3-phosphatidyltransferase, mitochondrial n=1 Tax=Leptidea sinapis TaxID=189913 RepID=UPI0021392378|nr:CDP-diacylglycerol--glycerol-3-phosphate 3-phosphatidyltransferase, mitochondrial [Leptidea sinapis]
MLLNGKIMHRFKSPEFQYFNWIYNAAPCFPIHASKINVMNDPKQFYDTLCMRFSSAKHRISIASLYIGTGELEKKLLGVTVENVKVTDGLKLNILLDYQRGSRGVVNSRTLFRQFFNGLNDKCTLALYQTPSLQGSWSKALPSRYNEIFGLQHMKLYISDDSVIISGANCSNDYFQKRQDRYIEIEDSDLAKFYCAIIDEVMKVSRLDNNDDIPNEISRVETRKRLGQNIHHLIDQWRKSQVSKISEDQDMEVDTWVFPLVQMGEFNITHDEESTCSILKSSPKGSYLRMATGYFNLTEKYAQTLLNKCESRVSLLMAHPNANGFMGAPGPAGGIPHAYSLIAKKFWQQVVDCNQTSRVQMLEYDRPGWTFHAKGLWYYPPGSEVPWMTVVGSANLGERSVRRDLEAQAAIFTTSKQLQNSLHKEYSRLHSHASECSSELMERHTPLWVRATVGVFKTYF